MTDMLEELLADLRENAVREIRPPGAEAARRTVRRRRTGKIVTSACALLAVVGGAFALIDRPAPQKAPTAAQTSAPSSPEQLALARISDGRPAFEVAEPVVAGYEHKQRMYLPYLTLQAACVGSGQITLVVLGDVKNDVHHKFKDKELSRVTIPCGAEPVPVTREIRTQLLLDMTFRLAEVKGAAGQAGFAYRITAKGGAPLAPDDVAASVEELVDEGNMRAGGNAPMVTPTGEFQMGSSHAEFPGYERYTLVLACRGEGTYALQIRSRGRVLADHTVECSWPPRAQEFRLPKALGKNVEFWERYDAAPDQFAETGWALRIR